jgi:hypothetical protein
MVFSGQESAMCKTANLLPKKLSSPITLLYPATEELDFSQAQDKEDI